MPVAAFLYRTMVTPGDSLVVIQLISSVGEQEREIVELHELLCLLYAYPDDRGDFEQVERMLRVFDKRPDLRRFADDLVDTGIAGTVTFYRFEAPTAHWLASHWGRSLTVDWEETDEARVARHLTLLALAAECPGLDEPPLEGRAWLERLRGTDTDAAFLIRRAADLQAKEAVRSRIYDELGLMVRLAPGPGTPSRTHARYARSPFVPQAGSMREGRPDLLAEAAVPPRDVRFVTPREGQRLIDLAREAMVTRSRDLHAFAFARFPAELTIIRFQYRAFARDFLRPFTFAVIPDAMRHDMPRRWSGILCGSCRKSRQIPCLQRTAPALRRARDDVPVHGRAVRKRSLTDRPGNAARQSQTLIPA